MSMIWILLLLVSAVWLALSLFAYKFVTAAFKKYKNYPRIQVEENCLAIVRNDFGKWDEAAIIRGCFTRFPLHLTVMGGYLFFFALFSTIRKYLYFPHKAVDLFRRYAGKLAFAFCLKLEEEYDSKEEISTPIVISNHVCWLDMIYMGSCFRTLSFVSKKEVSQVPIINSIAEFLDSLYVDRHSPDGRQAIREEIKNRVREFTENPKAKFPLIIYPEGTVSNGRSVMQFKNGAFDPLAPVTIFSLRYQCKQVHLGMDQITTAEHAIFAMCLRPTLRVRKFITMPQSVENVDEYKERCREKLAQMGGFKIYNCSFKDSLAYEKEIKAKVKAARNQR